MPMPLKLGGASEWTRGRRGAMRHVGVLTAPTIADPGPPRGERERSASAQCGTTLRNVAQFRKYCTEM